MVVVVVFFCLQVKELNSYVALKKKYVLILMFKNHVSYNYILFVFVVIWWLTRRMIDLCTDTRQI